MLFRLLFALCAWLILSGNSLPKLIILKDPLTLEKHINLGVTYEKQGDLDNALKAYGSAAKKLPRLSLPGKRLFSEEGMDKGRGVLSESNPERAR